MVNKIIKNKIINNEPFTFREVYEQLFFLLKIPEVNEEQKNTAQYVLKNFDKILINLDVNDILEILNRFKKTTVETIILEQLNNSMDIFIKKLNTIKYKRTAIYVTEIFNRLDNLPVLFDGKYYEFYKGINKDIFDVEYIIDTENKAILNGFMNAFIIAVQEEVLHPSNVFFFVNELKQSKKGIELLSNYSKQLMEITDLPIATLMQLEDAKIDLNIANEVIDKRIDDVVKELLKQNKNEHKTKKQLSSEEKVQETVKMLLDDLLKNENCKIHNIRKIGEGCYTSVYKIGTKVLKIGEPYETYKIPRDSKRFLKHLVRYNHDMYDGIKKINIVVCEQCKIPKHISEEELYKIYKDIRKDGMIWTDVQPNNVGELIKDNTIHFNKIKRVFGGNLGFKEENEVEKLKSGELVVIDLDLIFDENDPKIVWITQLSKKFEKRYQNERKKQTFKASIKVEKKQERCLISNINKASNYKVQGQDR